MALWFDFRRLSAIGYTCIGLCRSGRSVACCGSSAALPVFGSVWRFKPFCCVWRSGIPVKCRVLSTVKIKPLGGVSAGGMLGGCLAFPVVPLCGVPGTIAQFPVSVLRSVAPSGMLEGGKAVPVVIGYGWRFCLSRRAAVLGRLVAGGMV